MSPIGDNGISKKPDSLKAKIIKRLKSQPVIGGCGFEKAKSLFVLDTKRAVLETDRAWAQYIENRLTAEKRFHGPMQQNSREEVEMEVDDDNDEEFYGDDMLLLDLMRDNMACVEEDMCLDAGVLQSFRLLACEPVFSSDEVCSKLFLTLGIQRADVLQLCSVTALTRIYSPTRPTYVDVHFQYHYHALDDSVEWHYSIGFKIYDRPGVNDYRCPEVKHFERGLFDRGHDSNGWRPIAYGFYDNCEDYGRNWRRIENAKFLLEHKDAKDIYNAFWGPLEEDEEDEDAESERRKNMVDTIRVLLAVVGIEYDIAVDEDDRDSSGGAFMLEGLNDRWFARGVRRACGFQLTRDPENEKRGKAEQEAEARRDVGQDDDGDKFDSEDDDSEDYPSVVGSFK